ncbi:MAG: AraC family ligand binding domain-containing protein [Proteiniphilum sp.]|uniref:AraC family ligand binding domain-containing protein n=1 Tax=Proteiniphilum sp. TaxID=1926877 RepID=UPI002ABA3E63|nr:AraC family ligand binding domain-containing protein [Proteiniphilum sp.]MDY9920046.1 AraC family ligand binding domain-containing protein [Proteiniphilum sp.]
MRETKIDKIKKYHLHKNELDKLQFEIYPLENYLHRNEENTQKPHVHSFYQILWFISGEGKHYVDFNGYDVEANTLFFIKRTSDQR